MSQSPFFYLRKGNTDLEITCRFRMHPKPKWLSKLCVKIIIRFARIDVLSYLEVHHKDLFWSSFGQALLLTKASAVFGRTAILDFWKSSPSFLTKEYNCEALDFASKAGFCHVLDWWRNSGLPLRYTEASLEQASSTGAIEVLNWWHRAAFPQGIETHSHSHRPDEISTNSGNEDRAIFTSERTIPLRLKVGRSIIYTAQNGQATTLDDSGVPTAPKESVARITSANGHVNILQLWKERKGKKMQYDN